MYAVRKGSTVKQGRDTTSCRSQATLLKRSQPMEPDMDHPSAWNAEESTQALTWWLQEQSGQMERQWQIPQVLVRYWVDRGTYHSNMMKSHWKTISTLQHNKKEVGTQNPGNFHWTQKVFKDHWISAVTSKWWSKHAKNCVTNVQRSLEVETNPSLQSNKSDKGLINSLKALRNTNIDLKLLQDGDTVLTCMWEDGMEKARPT